MRARTLAVLAVFLFLLVPARPLWAAPIPDPFIYKTAFVGMPGFFVGGPWGFFTPTALRAGGAPTFRVFVKSSQGEPPSISGDFSALGLSATATTTGTPRHDPLYGQGYFYDFGPLSLDVALVDGIKEIQITATDTNDSVAATTTQIVADSTPPTLSLTSLSIIPPSPGRDSVFLLSGLADGTGSVARPLMIEEEFLDAAGNPLDTGFTSTRFNPAMDSLTAAFASSTDGTFTNVPIDYFGLMDPAAEEVASLRLTISVYDEAGNTNSASITVPFPREPSGDIYLEDPPPPPDPCADGSCISNVLFLPGIEGSRLYEGTGCGGDAEEKLWEPLGESVLKILRGAGDKKVRSLLLDDSGKSVCSDIYAKEADVIDQAGGSNIYASFLGDMDALKDEGAINDWKAIGYDWRLSLDDLLANGLQEESRIWYSAASSTPYIEQTLRSLAASSQTQKVTIVAHSNGGLVAKALLNSLGGETAMSLVDKLILVGVPQTGAPAALGALLFGHDQAISPYGLPIVSAAAARELAQNAPMAYHLLPTRNYLESVAHDSTHPLIRFDDGYVKEIEVYGTTIAEWSELADYLLAKEGGRTKPARNNLLVAEIANSSLLEYAERVHALLDDWTPPEELGVYQIAGWGVDTVAGVELYSLSNQLASVFAARHPKLYRPIFTEDGDGVVPIPSALQMASSPSVKRYWIDLDSYRKTTSVKRAHRDIFEIPSLRDFIKNILENGTSTPPFISLDQPSPLVLDKKLIFFLHSPLTLQVSDSSGNSTGLASDDSVTENIPNSIYGEFGDVKYVVVPAGEQYQLAMYGQEDGEFSLDIQEVSGGAIVNTTTIANVPTTPNTLASLTITSDSSISPLSVDMDNDGTTDISITPATGEIVSYDPPAPVVTPEPAPPPPPTGTAQQGSSSSGGGAISIPVPVATVVTTIATTTIATSTPAVPLATVAPISEVEAEIEISNTTEAPPIAPAAESDEKSEIAPQTASVYDAFSQQSVLKQVALMVYNGINALWRAFLKLF